MIKDGNVELLGPKTILPINIPAFWFLTTLFIVEPFF